MKTIRFIGALAVAGMVIAGCTDITNPIEETGEFAPAWIGFVEDEALGLPGSYTPIIFDSPTRVEEDVVIDYEFGGNAVFGADYVVVTDSGSTTPRTDVTAEGGTLTLAYDPAREEPHDTMWVFVPLDAADGVQFTVDITSAVTAGGDELTIGYLDDLDQFVLAIEGYVDIPTGSYDAVRSGDFGAATGVVTITKPAAPVVIDGIEYSFVISHFAGAGVFGGPIPWAFNVTSGGTVVAAPRSHVAASVVADVEGEFDFDADELELDVVLQCCGAAGFGWNLVATAQ